MTIEDTFIKDLKIITPRIFKDHRGYFTESYNSLKFKEQELNYTFIQDNQSQSDYGTIRGLHFQAPPYAQAKLVRAVSGTIWDVAVDLRSDSPTFGQHFALELSDQNFKQLLIPRGFAHGFSVLSPTATVLYKIDNIYSPEHERGIIFNDETLSIDWKIPNEKITLSDKDRKNDFFFTKKSCF